ncbi:hypothetical protein MBLNU13_g00544t2 [Cladosporium sp. NU13]
MSNDKDEKMLDNLAPTVTQQNGEMEKRGERRVSIQDAVFGRILEDGPNYRDVGWLGTSVLMMKTQIGLGVLSIPLVFDTLGMIPGIIVLIAIAMITTWSDYIVGIFKINHPEVYGIDDVGKVIFGKPGQIVLGTAFVLYWIFVAGAVFVAVAAIAGFCLASIQTLGKISWIAWVGLTGILAAIFTLTIAVGVQDRPSAAPDNGQPFVSDYKITAGSDWSAAISACSSLVFAYAGTPAFFSIVSEMRDPKKYTRSLVVCQIIVTVTYIAIGVIVYYFCGSFVASPALGSAGVTMKKVCYGLALPGLLATVTLVSHLPAKYIFVRLLRGSQHLTNNSVTHWAVWFGCTGGCVISSYIIASAIPVFGGLVSLIGALLGTLMSFQPMGFMWLYDNWRVGKEQKTLTWKLMVAWSVFVIVGGTFLMIGGTYGSIVEIKSAYEKSGGGAAWACADNSNSVKAG